jgi:predicted 3-demethylubiquinone-9 3-methyltransferase (glyoxalase superfamily)
VVRGAHCRFRPFPYLRLARTSTCELVQRDKWGLSWQFTPLGLTAAAITNPDRAAAKRAFEAMMEMRKIDIAAIQAARRS